MYFKNKECIKKQKGYLKKMKYLQRGGRIKHETGNGKTAVLYGTLAF